MKHSWLGFILVAALFHSGASQAIPTTFKFKGEVISTFFDPFDPFGGSIDVGTSFVGTYTFESTTPDAIPDPNVGSYSNFGAPFGMNVNIGGVEFNINEFLNIGVANDIGLGVDQYAVLAQQGQPFVDPEALSIELFLEDTSGTAFDSDALPLTPPDLDDFLMADFFLDGVRMTPLGDIFQFQVQGTLTALAVPEPSTVLLLALGLAGLGFVRPRQQRQRIFKA